MMRTKQTAIRDKMLQFSKLQLTELSFEELASLMLAIPVNHPHFFNVVAEVERRKVEALNKLPDGKKEEFIEDMQHFEEDHSEMIDTLARASNRELADAIIRQLSNRRGMLN